MKVKKNLAVLVAAVLPPVALLAALALVSQSPLFPPKCPDGVALRVGDTIQITQPQCVGGLLGSPFVIVLLVIIGIIGATIAWRKVRVHEG